MDVNSQARKLLGRDVSGRKDLNYPLTAVRGIFDTVSAVGGIFTFCAKPRGIATASRQAVKP
ncbi:MAG: hypothetical protein C5B44_06680 [Acidobacteria bacterium]|nr:MAG: hypothetical protein C5B44_06680 [Acidobacteriota bacterium]